jgi:hypothetical protein
LRQSIDNELLNYYNFNSKILLGLTFSNSTTISPSFSSNTFSYSTTVSNATTNITAVSLSESAIIQVKVNGGAYTAISNGIASAALSLNFGINTVEVRVLGLDGSNQAYIFSVLRPSASGMDYLGLPNLTSPASFSIRKVSSSYTGNAIQVRRSNDNALQNIGFTINGDLDTTALKNFVGNNNGFVSIWYDQSGNGRNASQTTSSLQPSIVSGGVISRRLGQPSIYFLNTRLETNNYTGYPSEFTIGMISAALSNSDISTSFFRKGSNSGGAPWFMLDDKLFVGNGITNDAFDISSNSSFSVSNKFNQRIFSRSSTLIKSYMNGSNFLSTSSTIYADAGGSLTIGSPDGSRNING